LAKSRDQPLKIVTTVAMRGVFDSLAPSFVLVWLRRIVGQSLVKNGGFLEAGLVAQCAAAGPGLMKLAI
jgi:hypothetical protein